MKRIIHIFLFLLVFINFISCIQLDVVINVQPDGKGTIEEMVLIKKEVMNPFKTFGSQMTTSESSESENSFNLHDEEELKKNASKFGEGVTYLSSEKIVNEKFDGYKAIYEFSDINKIQINQNPGENMPSQGSGDETETKKEFIKFNLKKGAVSELTIKLPNEKSGKKKKPPADSESSPSDNEQPMQMMKMMFDGMKISIRVDIQGTIIETDADQVEESSITLMEIDFNKILAEPEYYEKLNSLQPDTIEDTKELIKDIPGIKINLQDPVTVKFK